MDTSSQPMASGFELRYEPLSGRVALSFPCDADGHVDVDSLSERALANYRLAATLIGRDYAVPVVLHLGVDPA